MRWPEFHLRSLFRWSCIVLDIMTNPSLPSRRLTRAVWHQYNEGLFFITACTHLKKHCFGSVRNDVMELNGAGRILDKCIKDIPCHYPDAEVHAHVVMPNHFHILLHIKGPFASYKEEYIRKFGCQNSRLSAIIGSIKAAASRSIRMNGGEIKWQRSFHDHIVRGFEEYQRIAYYIETNPQNWLTDCFAQ